MLCVLQILKETVHVHDQDQQQSNVVESEATVEASAIEKRVPKLAAIMKSPFLNEFDSSDAKTAGKRVVNEADVVKQIIPFEK